MVRGIWDKRPGSEKIDEDTPLYNSRILRVYLRYLVNRYPDLDVDSVLKGAGIPLYELQDPGRWFSQRERDRFYEALVGKTNNPHIAREAGRYSVSSGALGAAQQYTLSLLSPSNGYLMMGKLYSTMSRGAEVTTRKLTSNKVEITCVPRPGVREKPNQCENRIGTFESLAQLFTQKYAEVEHPSCFHRGDGSCRYLITWEKTPSLAWKELRNLVWLLSLAAAVVILVISPNAWGVIAIMGCALASMLVSCVHENLEKKRLLRTLELQGDAAKDLIEETNIRHNNALLVQEMGRATSKILDTDQLMRTVVSIMEKRLDFDRGLIMLANNQKTSLVYTAGFGWDQDQPEVLHKTEFHLDNPDSRGPFVLAFNEKRPVWVNGMAQVAGDLSRKSLEFSRQLGAESFICVPLLYEDEPLGILAVDRIHSKKPLTQSDVNILEGLASHMAISIMNATSFHKLQESEKKYRELVENANSIIMRMDTQGAITFFNEFSQKFFGFRDDEIIGLNIRGTILPDNEATQRWLDTLKKDLLQDPEELVSGEKEIGLRDRSRAWIAFTYRPILGDNGTLGEILCIGNDVTKRKLAEEEKKRLEARLLVSQKMEAIGRLAGGVAHDLNNILSGIVSYPDLLLMEIPRDSPLRQPMLTMKESGEKAAAIVQDLLTLARRGVGVSEVLNLNTIITDLFRSPEYQKLVQERPDVRFVVNLAPDLLNISGSPVHLSKTILNLVYNASEAMDHTGGTISVSTENRYMDKPARGRVGMEEGEYAAVVVEDTGKGIAPEDLPKIFEPFYTKKVMGRSGTGLGLAVVWGTVKDHMGHIEVQSTPGLGARFDLCFPTTRKQVDRKADSVSIEQCVGTEKVLVVDDVKEQRDIAARLLSKLGYSVTARPSGEDAVEYLKNNQADVLVLDMIMEPGMDGLQTYKEILKLRPGMKAVITSGYSETERVKEAQSLGAGAYIKKPYTLEKLGVALRTALAMK